MVHQFDHEASTNWRVIGFRLQRFVELSVKSNDVMRLGIWLHVRHCLSTRNGKKLIFRMVKVHQMHHVGAIEKHMNITSDLILPLPQAGFHLMWFSDLPEYADATRRSFHEKGRNLQRRKTTTGKWLGWCFPCQFVFVFFLGGGHV